MKTRKKPIDSLSRGEERLLSRKEPGERITMLNELVWDAVQLLKNESDASLQEEVINRMYRFHEYREKILDSVQDWPFTKILEIANERLENPAPGVQDRGWNISYNKMHPYEKPVLSPPVGDGLRVRHVVTDDLVNWPRDGSGSKYLDERIAERVFDEYLDTRFRYYRNIYEVMVELEAIERYPERYSSPVADFLRMRPEGLKTFKRVGGCIDW